MKPVKFLFADESGEVTIGWVALVAAVVSLSIVVLSSIGDGTSDLAENLDGEMQTREVGTLQ